MDIPGMLGKSPERRPPGARSLVSLLAIQFLAGAVATPLLAFLPLYVEQKMGLGQAFTADVRAIWLGGMVVFALVGGAMSDSMGRKLTFVVGLSGPLVGAAIFATESRWLVGFVIPAYLGVAEGLFVTAGQSYLMEVSPRGRLALMTALYFSGFTVGSMAGGLAGGAVAERGGFGALGLFVAAGSVAILALALFLIPGIDEPGRGGASLVVSLRGYGPLLRRRDVQLLVAMQTLRTFFWGAFQLMGPVMMDRLTGSKFVVGAFVAATTGVGLVSMLFVGRYSDRHGRRLPVLITLAGSGIAAICLGLFAESVAGLFVAGTLGGAFAWALSGQMTPIAREFGGERESGRAMGLVNAPWGLAALGGAQIGGRMVAGNASEAFYLVGALALLALPCAWWLFRQGAPARSGEAAF